MVKRKLLYVILALLVVGGIIGVWLWQSRSAAQKVPDDSRSATAKRGPMLIVVSASGNIEPRQRVNLPFETGGQVTEVVVGVGERIEKGDVLVQLDAEQLALQVKQAQATLASAEAQLAKLQVGPQSEEVEASEANLRAAEAQVSAAAADLDQLEAGASQAQIASAEANLASAITQQKKAKDAHDRTLKCFTFEIPGTGEERTICPALGVPEEQSRYNLQAANEALEAARAQLDETVSGADVDQLRAARANVAAAAAQRDVAQAQLDLLLEGVSEEQIEAVEAQVAQARVALKQAELSLEQATLVAPFDGVVAAVNVTIGEQVSAGLPAVTMVDKSECFITVSVDEIDVAQIEKGQAAEITLDALPETTITGTVKRIAPASGLEEGIVTYDVTIGLSPTDAPIRTDMTANATILVDELDDVLQIPTWVVRVDPDSGQTYVHRRVGDKIERVDVKLGVRHQGTVEVLDGLTEGDNVVRLPESEAVQLEHP